MSSDEPGPWYEDYFDENYFRFHGFYYADTITAVQLAFLRELLEREGARRALDACCGHCRHSLSLAKAGYEVTGVDFSRTMLQAACELAEGEQTSLRVIQADIRELPVASGYFDTVLNMFSSFGYFETDAEHIDALREFARVLKPGGLLVLDLLNRDTVLADFEARQWVEMADGTITGVARRFNTLEGRIESELVASGPEGRLERYHSVRLFNPQETRWLLTEAGLQLESLYGGYDSSSLELDSPRMIALARKPR
jgi:ubiquinone/menaquinone biosynthesis C-methylase UbiE